MSLVSANNRKWFIAITAALAALVEIVDSSIVNVALTEMQSSLGATLSEIGWVITSYAIANVIILPLSAWLGDVFGKKRYFIFSLIGFTASSVLCGLSTSLWMLIVARILQGLTGGGLVSKAQSILFETFPKEEQGQAQALFGIVAISGPAIGPTLGGYIVTNLDWRWIFFINLPIGIAAVAMATTFLPEDPIAKAVAVTKDAAGKVIKVGRKIDFLGLIYLVIGLGSLQTVLEEGQSEEWFESKMIVGLSIAAVVALALFVREELTVAEPVVDLRVLRHRSLAAGSLFSMVLGMGLYGALFAVPIFAQSILKFTAQDTGMLLLPGALASAFMMPIAGIVARKIDPRIVIAGGAVTLTTAILLLGRLSPLTGVDDLFWPLVLRGAGTVFMFLPLSMAAIAPLPKEDMAKATGFYNLTRQLGGSIGIAFLTGLLDRRGAFHAQHLSESVNPANPTATFRLNAMTHLLEGHGVPHEGATHGALQMLAGATKVQAMIRSFNDTFYATAALLVLSLPLLFLLRRPPADAKVDAGH